MKTLLLTLLVTFNIVSYGQTDTSRHYIYCELEGVTKFMSPKVTIAIDEGQAISIWKDERLRDEVTGKIRTFNSMIEALNYMSEKGWELQQASYMNAGSVIIYRWILKRPSL
ncbi:MAG: hypothetical protein V4590_02355 [Bacteroidota bacterium]